MKQYISGLLGLVVATIAIGLHFYQKPPKMAYVETSVLMSQFTEAITAQKKLEESQKQWNANLKLLNDSLAVTMNRMKLGYEKASKEEKDAMRNSLDRWNSDLNRYSKSVVKMAEERERELMGPVVDKLNSFLSEWGKHHGYDMIFGTMAGGNIVQANGDYNLTSRISADLNAEFKDVPTRTSKSDPTSHGAIERSEPTAKKINSVAKVP